MQTPRQLGATFQALKTFTRCVCCSESAVGNKPPQNKVFAQRCLFQPGSQQLETAEGAMQGCRYKP